MTNRYNVEVFEKNTLEYDQWFERHAALYQSEILALKRAVPTNKKGIEIGVGTGRFARPLNVKYGVEPSENMASMAEQIGIKVYRAYGEYLPIDNATFDFVLIVTTVCFLFDIPKTFSEAHRILKPKGEIILGFIDKNSKLGKKYEKEKATKKFYRDAHFHSTEEITGLLEQAGFQDFQYWQTLMGNQNTIEQPQKGFGKGGFVVIKGRK
jgi:ubiquinone/menaquinone biosynthesis C-methylase UbiE